MQVPSVTTSFISHVEDAAAAPAPSFNQLVDDVRPFVLTRHDATAVRRMRSLGVRYTSFVEGLAIDAGGKLADALGASS